MSPWLIVKLVSSKVVSENVKSLIFEVPEWPGHKAGQYCDIRLTSDTGYQAQRSYSIASTPVLGSKFVEFGVKLFDNGEVSPYLWNLAPGDKIEIKGPLGGHFIWSTDMPGPLVLIAGGSGIVPLISMLREYVRYSKNTEREVVLLVSAFSREKIPYYTELEKYKRNFPNIKILYTLTKDTPADWTGFARRVDKAMLAEITSGLLDKMPITYVCGPTGFVEAVANTLVEIGFNPHSIKTERFG